jgi:hypothetical protein
MMPAIDDQAQSALSETQYLLKHWRLSASASGLLWIQPVARRLAPEELAGFLTFLRQGCAESFPMAVLFDFHETDIVGSQWTLVESLLGDFSASVGAKCRITAGHKRPVAAVLMYRHESEMAAALVAPRPPV